MSDIVNSVAQLSQSTISQFFSPVSADEARTANARTANDTANISPTDYSVPEIDANPNLQRRSRGNLKIFQLNTAKKSGSGSALSRLMGACRYSVAFVTEPPFYHGKVCGFSNANYNILHHIGNNKRCRAAIVASKGVELCPLPAYTDEDTHTRLE